MRKERGGGRGRQIALKGERNRIVERERSVAERARRKEEGDGLRKGRGE